jgi:hypothetical protein
LVWLTVLHFSYCRQTLFSTRASALVLAVEVA